jgi:hypothetical protein
LPDPTKCEAVLERRFIPISVQLFPPLSWPHSGIPITQTKTICSAIRIALSQARLILKTYTWSVGALSIEQTPNFER